MWGLLALPLTASFTFAGRHLYIAAEIARAAVHVKPARVPPLIYSQDANTVACSAEYPDWCDYATWTSAQDEALIASTSKVYPGFDSSMYYLVTAGKSRKPEPTDSPYLRMMKLLNPFLSAHPCAFSSSSICSSSSNNNNNLTNNNHNTSKCPY